MAKICRGLILFLILAVAIVIWHGGRTAIEIKSVVVQITCMLILFLSALNLLSEDKILISRKPVVILAGVYGILMTGAYLRTNMSSLNYQALMPQLFGILVFMLVIHHFSKDDIGKLICLCVAAGVISSLYGILQYFHFDPLKWENIGAFGTLRVVSFFGNKNYFAIFLLLMIPMGGYIALTSERRISIIVGTLSTVCMIVALSLSYSKGAFIGFFLSATASGALLFLRKKQIIFKDAKNYAPASKSESGSQLDFLKKASFCIPLVLMLMIVFLSQDIQKDYSRRIKRSEYHIMQRLSFYQAAAEIITRHPFFGVGPGNFAVSYQENEKYKVKTYNPNDVLNHVHNDFLEIWAEYGLFSLLAYIGILSAFFHEWAKGFKKACKPDHQLGFVLIFCSLTGYLFYSLLTVAGRYMSSVFYFWLIMGIGYLYIRDAQNEFVSVPNRLKQNKRIAGIVTVFFLLIFGVGCKKILANYISDVYMSRGYDLASRGNYDESLKYLDSAVRLQTKAVEAYYQRGFVYFSKNRIDEAIGDYNKVNEMAPNYVNVNFNLASCFYKKRDWEKAIRMAEISHRRFPDYLPGMMLLAYAYYHKGQFQKAVTYCDQVLKRYKGHKAALSLRKKLKKF